MVLILIFESSDSHLSDYFAGVLQHLCVLLNHSLILDYFYLKGKEKNDIILWGVGGGLNFVITTNSWPFDLVLVVLIVCHL